MTNPNTGPLAGLRILDLSTVIAGPWASTLLADLGAEVLKLELPDGSDALRQLPPHKENTPLWWKTINRNKRGVTLDVRKPEGKALFLKMLTKFDVLVENFRTGTLDRWGLDKGTLWQAQPKLVILRVTGFGQTGPYRAKPGFARVFEAMSGFTHICGAPDGPPLHAGFPLGDSFAGLFGALGILSAMYHRLKHPETPGQEIDLAATEAMFRVVDFLAVEYDQLGTVRERIGNLNAYAAPSNVYRTRDGKWISLAVSAQSVFERFARALGRPELIADPRFVDNRTRVHNRAAIDEIVAAWIGARDLAELVVLLSQYEITFSPIYSIREVLADPHFIEREMVTSVDDGVLGPVKMHNVVPRFSATPGAIRSTGPELGEHNAEVYAEFGLDAKTLRSLKEMGVV
jgi:crotonobetainyl-CoA:carnitine CoA-transferase CaiB-like acyl-CoA transferase